MPRSTDISVVLTFHGEGRIAHRTFRGLQGSVSFAQRAGRSVQIVAVLDRVNDNVLKRLVENWSEIFGDMLEIYEADFGSLSLSRNFGISQSRGQVISVLDGDDFYGKEWLVSGYQVCTADRDAIAHPEAIYYFPLEPILRVFENYSPAFLNLMFQNLWPALVMAHRSIFDAVQYSPDNASYGFEDWLWNCETASHGFRHVIVPGTLMAVRQKTQMKSLWQNSVFSNKVVKPNSLFKKVFSMEYVNYLGRAERGHTSQLPPLRNISLKALNWLQDSLNDQNKALFHLYEAYKRISPIKNRFICPHLAVPKWIRDELHHLSEFEPGINRTDRFQIRRYPRRIKCKNIITESMAALVKATGSNIFIIDRLDSTWSCLCSLSYLRTVNNRLFVITTEKSDNSLISCLPENTVQIDIGRIALSYRDRSKLLHRLLLESDPKFIHVIGSKLAYQLLDRYPGTFSHVPVFASFFDSARSDRHHLGSYDSIEFLDIFDIFTGITTNTHFFKKHLIRVFGTPKTQIHHLPTPFVPWFFGPLDPKIRFFSRKGLHPFSVGRVLRILYILSKGPCRSDKEALKAFSKHRGHSLRMTVRFLRFDSSLANPHLFSFSGGRSLIHLCQKFSINDYDLAILSPDLNFNPFLVTYLMANGIPVITENIPQYLEIVNEKTGWIIDTESGSIERVLREVTDYFEIVHDKGIAARDFINQHHSWNGFKEKVSELYESNVRKQVV